MIPLAIIDGVIAITTSAILLLIFFILYINKFETKSTLLFIIVLFFATVISFGQMMVYPAVTYEQGIFWQKVYHIGFALLVPFWVIFVNYYWKKINKFYFFFIFSVSLMNVYFILFSNLFITNIHHLFKGNQLIGKEGVLYNYFIGFYFIIIVIEYIKFIYNYSKSGRKNKQFHLPIIIGVGILILTGFKDLLETFFDTGIPMLFSTGVTLMNVMFAYSLIMKFIKLHRDLERKKRLEHEIKIALDIQRKILPCENKLLLKELEIFGINEPAYEIGGDFYDFYKLKNNKIAFFIGDVAGKSVPAALYMAMTWSIIKALTEHYCNPAELLYHVNKFLYNNSESGMFITLIYGIFDIKKQTILYSSAGHTFPIYYKHKENRLEMLKFQNKPLGLYNNLTFKEVKIPFNKNDIFFLYTDGIIEATNKKDLQFGEKNLLRVIKTNINVKAEKLSKILLSEINKFYGSANKFDDLTILTLKKT